MKPLQLTMTAFGPYKTKETIDFRELGVHRLFAISGQTGAGKTTIFDGISFALYGSGSGEDRKDTKTMRSDFADDKDYTAVELLFELRGKTYRVLRQLGHIKKGNKTATGERYEFFEVAADGSETPAVDRQKVSDINKKIEQLLGLTQQQFKQIVMLPQGEFRKLLTSDSKEKEEILRKIFKTEPLDQLVKRLDAKRLTLAKETASAKAVFEANVQQLATLPTRESTLFTVLQQQHYNVHQLLDGLTEEAAYYNDQMPSLTAHVQQARTQHDALQQQLGAATRFNEELATYERACNDYEALQQQQQEMTALRTTWQRAEQAAAIQPYFTQQQQAAQRIVEATQQRQTAEAHEQTIAAQLTEVKKQYDKLAAEQHVRDEQRLQIDRLTQLKPYFAERERASRDVAQKTNELQQAQATYDEHVARLHSFTERLQREKDKLATLLQEAEPLQTHREQVQTLQAQWEAYEALTEQRQAVTQSFAQMEAQHAQYVTADHAYRQAYEMWLENEAAQLADLLEDGQPCAVCGSTTHPKRAARQQGVKTKSEIEHLRQQAEQQQRHYHQAQAAHTQAQQLLARFAEQCEALQVNEQQGHQLHERLQQVEQQLAATTAADEAATKLRKVIDNASVKLQVEQQQERTNKEQLQQLHTALAVAQEQLTQIEQRLPNEFATSEALERALLQLQQAHTEAVNAWQHVQQLYQATDKQYDTAKEKCAFTLHIQQQAEAAQQAAQQTWQQQLQTAFENIEQFEAALLPVEKRQALQQQLDQYRDAWQAAKAIVEQGQERFATRETIEIGDLQAQIHTKAAQLQQAMDALHACKQAHEHCTHMQRTFTTSNDEMEALVQQEAELTTLYDLLRGKNAKKVSFERYVQIGFLEQITEAANIRLRYLSNGQFTLQCSDRLEGGGKQSGLSLDVYDAYTGLLRDVKTLSGGEKFNASLALALGMADVIQSFEGNIQIETMFIDEGFGSLDEETLTKAVDTLVDLQKSGRMIGIISHVNELKAAMPAVLQVTKSKEGYSTTAFIVK